MINKIKISITISKSLKTKLDEKSKELNLSRSGVIEYLIEKQLANNNLEKRISNLEDTIYNRILDKSLTDE